MSFHLRPVSDSSASPSPVLESPDEDHSPFPDAIVANPPYIPSHRPSTSTVVRSPSRRPLSPTSIRELDLSHVIAPGTPRNKFPPPPTGHDLMSLFPVPSPYPRNGSTSNFFREQEISFFSGSGNGKVAQPSSHFTPHRTASGPASGPASAPTTHTTAATTNSSTAASSGSPPVTLSQVTPLHLPLQSSPAAPVSTLPPPPPPLAPPTPGGPGAGPIATHAPLPPRPPQPSMRGGPGPGDEEAWRSPMPPRPPPPLRGAPVEEEAWRSPMPYSDRRRAGKHTRRVIVR